MQRKHDDITERATAAFEPDTLLPTQYFDRLRGHGRPGEWLLMIAILEDAVNVYRKQMGAPDEHNRKLFEEAEAWIEDRDGTWIFSFESICDILGLDADYLRRGLRALKTRQRRPDEAAEAEIAPEDTQGAFRKASSE